MNPSPEQFARLEQLFAEAMELSPELRPALLARVHEEEGAALDDQLESLLDATVFQPPVS